MRLCILALLLAGCTLGGGKFANHTDGTNPITGNAIAVTSLDAPAVQPVVDGAKTTPADDAKTTPVPTDPAKVAAKSEVPKAGPIKAKPAKPAETPVAETPARVVSPEELACVKKGGQWTVAGKAGGMSCVSLMRDAGKSCRKQSDCKGSCLARSKTCAPIAPLFGCNDILQDNGAMVTLCID